MLFLTRKKGESIRLVDNRLCSDPSQQRKTIAIVKVMQFLPNGIVELGIEAEPYIGIERDDMKKDRYGKESKE